MNLNSERMIEGNTAPSEKDISKWIGKENFKRWKSVIKFINKFYTGVFPENDWIFGGKKYGWFLRFKKSKSFCSLIPERNRLLILIVFGAEERRKAEVILNELDPVIVKTYNEATTYHDGKWVVINLNRDELFNDIEKILFIKRKPKTLNK